MCRRLWIPLSILGCYTHPTPLLWFTLQGPGTSNNHQCWVRTEPRLGNNPGMIPEQHFWSFWDFPGAETFGVWWFCTSMLSVSRARMKIRFAPGEHLVPSLEAPWKRWFEQNRSTYLTPLYFYFLYLEVGNLLSLFLRRFRQQEQ